jgi:hypothetical protein
MQISASVHPLLNGQDDEWFIERGYIFSVILQDEQGDVIDILDFKNEFAACTYAASINLQGKENAPA